MLRLPRLLNVEFPLVGLISELSARLWRTRRLENWLKSESDNIIDDPPETGETRFHDDKALICQNRQCSHICRTPNHCMFEVEGEGGGFLARSALTP